MPATNTTLLAAAAAIATIALVLRRRQKPQDDDDATRHVYRIVLTGGPCAGKTTAMARLSGFLQERGFRVYTVPEMATLLFTNGVAFSDLDKGALAMQQAVLKGQTTLEDGFRKVAAATRAPAVVLCDRGALDGKAYISDDLWRIVAHNTPSHSINERLLCERYDAVLHLVTAAAGAERFYTLENNLARTESVEEARKQDIQTQKAWAPHPRLYVVDNAGNGGFEGKLERVVEACAAVVGLPVLPKHTRKFLLKSDPLQAVFSQNGVRTSTFRATKTFLKHAPQRDTAMSYALPQSPSSYSNHAYVRKRISEEGSDSYQYSEVIFDGNERHERKRRISRREYELYLRDADPERSPVEQARLHFLYENQSFVVHRYLDRNLAVLHCQAARPDGVALPPFLDVGAEIAHADRERFSAYGLAALPVPRAASPEGGRRRFLPPSRSDESEK